MIRQPIETDTYVKGFFGKYRPLSNYDLTPFKLEYMGKTVNFKSGEHAFHYFKTLDPIWQEKILEAETPSEAKVLGRKCLMREDWDEVKVQIIENMVYLKFSQNKNLKDLLLSTGEKYLEETNDWNDKFWGVCNGVGENNLGKCLMRVREQLKSEGGRD